MDPWVLDLDGVVWRGDEPIPGASSAVAALRAAGHPVWCCTNNSAATVADYESKLAAHGIEHDGLITSAMAMATLIRPGERVLACAEAGAREALDDAGAVIVADGTDVDSVVVGFHRDFDYAEMQRATRAVLGGARLIATNDDPIYPDHDGPSPGCGAILASIERATGVRATVAGKPNLPMVEIVRARCGDRGVLVGDSVDTDGALADALRWRFGLVLTGNTARAAAGSAGATWVADDLASLVETALDQAGLDQAGLDHVEVGGLGVTRRRLDVELVRRGMAESRNAARSLIASGRVTVRGAPADKPARLVDPAEAVVVAGEPDRYVGRGGHKLAAALDGFGIDPTGWRVLDAGASTGGFTDCLLQHGAAQVIAVDVGHGQLHERLRSDPRVVVRERQNVRSIQVDDLDGPVDAAVADLSFISLSKVVGPIAAVVRPGGDLVALVKPQFEAGRREVSKGRGVISDPNVWRRVLREALDACRGHGAAIMGVMVSPLRGADGNVEFLVHARFGADPVEDRDIDVDAVVSSVSVDGEPG